MSALQCYTRLRTACFVTYAAGHRMFETKDESSLSRVCIEVLPVLGKRCVQGQDRVCSFDYSLHVVIVTAVVIVVL